MPRVAVVRDAAYEWAQSGIGREMGVPGLEEYLVSKTIARPAS